MLSSTSVCAMTVLTQSFEPRLTTRSATWTRWPRDTAPSARSRRALNRKLSPKTRVLGAYGEHGRGEHGRKEVRDVGRACCHCCCDHPAAASELAEAAAAAVRARARVGAHFTNGPMTSSSMADWDSTAVTRRAGARKLIPLAGLAGCSSDAGAEPVAAASNGGASGSSSGCGGPAAGGGGAGLGRIASSTAATAAARLLFDKGRIRFMTKRSFAPSPPRAKQRRPSGFRLAILRSAFSTRSCLHSWR